MRRWAVHVRIDDVEGTKHFPFLWVARAYARLVMFAARGSGSTVSTLLYGAKA